MPTHLTTPTVLSARLLRLMADAQRVADRLLALDLDAVQAEICLAPAAASLAWLLDGLEDAMYRAERVDQRHRAADLAMARALAA